MATSKTVISTVTVSVAAGVAKITEAPSITTAPPGPDAAGVYPDPPIITTIGDGTGHPLLDYRLWRQGYTLQTVQVDPCGDALVYTFHLIAP